MTKHPYTRGPVIVSSSILVCSEAASIIANCGFGIGEGLCPPLDEAEANASLIAEAFNVATETGMTPRELADRVKQLEAGTAILDPAYVKAVADREGLLDALKFARATLQGIGDVHKLKSIEIAVSWADAAITKAQT